MSNFYSLWKNNKVFSVKLNNYFDDYENLLSSYVGKKITIVEIGGVSGGSLQFWRRIFGSDARIIGSDLNNDAKKWRKYGFEIYIGNQGKKNFWESFFKDVGMVDVVIDDGSHTYFEQITTLLSCVPKIKNNGLFITEDVHSSFQKKYGYPSKYSFVNFTNLISSSLHSKFEGSDKNSNYLPQEVENKIFSIEHFSSIVSIKIKDNQKNKTKLVFNDGDKDEVKHAFTYETESKQRIILIYFIKKFNFLKKYKFIKFLVDKINSIIAINFIKKQNKKSKIYFKND